MHLSVCLWVAVNLHVDVRVLTHKRCLTKAPKRLANKWRLTTQECEARAQYILDSTRWVQCELDIGSSLDPESQ